jgi:hypothetical protein
MKKHLILSLIIIGFYSCQKDRSPSGLERVVKYDIFPIIGQSNAYNGYGLDYNLDKTVLQIKQLGRFGINNYKVITGKDPLEHHIIAPGCNSFATHFALKYVQQYGHTGRDVLLIPGAKNSSSFVNSQWRKGDTLYNDIVRRVKYVLETYPGSEIKAFLWHQGESDITDMRRDVAGPKGDSIPFILGGMVPYWVDLRPDRKITDSVIAETIIRLPSIGYANARSPFIIAKSDNTVNDIHFDAAGQRELGKRYFEAYQKLQY